MGIHKLIKFIEITTPDAITVKNLQEYNGSKLAIDASQTIHRFGISRRKQAGRDMLTSTNKPITHLHAFSKRTEYYLNLNILPIYTFDGKSNSIKDEKVIERKNNKISAEKKLVNSDNNKDKIKYFKKTYSIKHYEIKECRDLLTAMGIPNIQSPEEADQQLAAFVKAYSDIYAVVTDDTDVLVFGAPKMIKDFHGCTSSVYEINLSKILIGLRVKANEILLSNNKYMIADFTQENFINLCILFGCDYCPKIKLINKTVINNTLESNVKLFELFVLNNLNVDATVNFIKVNYHNIYYVPQNFIERWIQAKNYYIDAPIYNPLDINISMQLPNIAEMINILHTNNEFNISVITNRFTQLENYYYSSLKTNSEINIYYNSFPNFSSYRQKYNRTKNRSSYKTLYNSLNKSIIKL